MTGGSDSPQAVFTLSTKKVTVTGLAFTLRWAAPEILMEGRAGLGSDVWALGWICFEIMTNEITFQHIKPDTEVILGVFQGEAPSVLDDSRCSPARALCNLMTDCWELKPKE